MTRLPTALAVMALLASPLTAQERPAAILVLDGSGSMWGQIDGTAKITIAQDVIGGLMTTLPADLDLGLTVYGHRRKGDCADIETLVMPGPDTRGAITGAVNGIKPKGKTPMADAVVAAAKALRDHQDELLEANAKDVASVEGKKPDSFIDRLKLTPDRIEGMASA
ncbi:MAG: VWA domain-containing protein, partial [Pseudomonadota bacterium]|nr:VWA domain-containing protein [Pseudomonadota bacterium]